MDKAASLKVAQHSQEQADRYLAVGNVGRAFPHLLIALKLNPGLQLTLKELFATTLCEWGRYLEGKERYTDLFACYEQALEVFPENEFVLNNLGAHLLRCESLREARRYFLKSLEVNPEHLQASRNLENVSNLIVERWHFRMLNDEHRNDAFREAVLKAVRRGNHTVLDIGTGTGLLSLFAVEAGARHVYACDHSEAMVDMARLVFHHNEVPKERVTLIKKHSTDMSVPEDLPGRVPLVVCEILDCGLLGEHVLDTLIHAWDHLLQPDGCVVPCAAALYMAGVHSQQLSRRYHVARGHVTTLDNIAASIELDAYDTQDLRRVEFKYLTKPFKVAEINFNVKEELEEFVTGARDRSFSVTCTDSGRLDCLVAWFELRLDEDIVLDTSPSSKAGNCWDQAVFPLPQPLDVHQDQELECHVSFHAGKLNLSCPASKPTGHNLSEAASLLLNTPKLQEYFQEVQTPLEVGSGGSRTVLDLWPFPVAGMKLLETSVVDRLVSVVTSECDVRVVLACAEQRGLTSRVTCVTEEDADALLEAEDAYDVVLVNPVDTSGELKEKVLSQIVQLRRCLKSGGVVEPSEVTVLGRLVDSDWLDRVARVSDERVTCDFLIHPFINAYQVNSHIDFELSNVELSYKSEEFTMFTLQLSTSPTETLKTTLEVPVSSPGRINALVYWFRFGHVDTDSDSHVRQAAILFPARECNTCLKLSVLYKYGLFTVTPVNCSE